MLFNACKHSCVINPRYDEEIHLIKYAIVDFCEKSGISYALIIHNKDFDEYGIIKKVHIHLYIEGKSRIKSEFIINSIREYMLLHDSDFSDKQFSDRKVVSDVYCLQYFIHKNNPDKYQYSIDDVISNDDRLLQKIVDGVINIDESTLIDMVNKLDYYQLLCELGLEYCRLNHNVIMYLYKLKRSGN